MAAHQIGVPTLREEIIAADTPRHRDVPLSTLQRFLAGRHRTQDHHVDLCAVFAAKHPGDSAQDRAGELGAALCGFFPEAESLSENWVGDRHKAMAYDLKARPSGRGRPPSTQYARFTFEKSPHGSHFYWRDESRPDDPDSRHTQLDGPKFRYEGVAVQIEKGLMLGVSRDMLTRKPRIALMTKKPDSVGYPGGEFTCEMLSGTDMGYFKVEQISMSAGFGEEVSQGPAPGSHED